MKLRQNGIVSLMIRPAVFLAGGRAYMKLQIVEGMWNGFESYFLDRMNRIKGIFSPAASGPSAEGR